MLAANRNASLRRIFAPLLTPYSYEEMDLLAMNAGLDSAILDPTNRDMMGVIFATSALLGEDDFCMEYIEAYRDGIFGPKKD